MVQYMVLFRGLVLGVSVGVNAAAVAAPAAAAMPAGLLVPPVSHLHIYIRMSMAVCMYFVYRRVTRVTKILRLLLIARFPSNQLFTYKITSGPTVFWHVRVHDIACRPAVLHTFMCV